MFLELCFEITKDSLRCAAYTNPPAIVEQNPIKACPYVDAYECAGFYDRLRNTVYVKSFLDITFKKAILLHEVCHWLVDYGGCGCDPYELQRRYLWARKSYLDWALYYGIYHNKTRECAYNGPVLLRKSNR